MPISWSVRCTTARVSGISLHGDRFFYENPLASRGGTERWIWHRCPCCPANIARLVASLGQYVASVAPGEISLHLYGQSRLTASVDGREVELRSGDAVPMGWRCRDHDRTARPAHSPAAAHSGLEALVGVTVNGAAVAASRSTVAISASNATGPPAIASCCRSPCRFAACRHGRNWCSISAASHCSAGRSSTASRKPMPAAMSSD